MLFNSLTFVVFLVALIAVDRSLPSWRARKTTLLVASYLFYAAWNPPFVLLLWLSTVVDWWAARRIASTPHEAVGRRRLFVSASLLVNLGLLAFFKYGEFVLENLVALAGAAGVAWTPAAPDIVLPVGISFYTFQTLSYTLDVYRGRLRPSGSFLDFALYVTFFPQLVAGPIVRAGELLPQFAEPRRADAKTVGWGAFLLSLGLFQKVVVADTLLAPAADAVFGWARGPVAGLDAWVGTLAFSAQIFCDFAGYSTCAIGVALCLGFSLPDNFRRPYAAVGFRDFWRRWHVTLSTWLRDYLYIPLGGSRNGAVRTGVALMATMLIGGLWHGAAWTFVAWGGLHGIYLVAERGLRNVWGRRPVPGGAAGIVFLAALTHVLVLVTWVFFRAPDFGRAGLLLGAMGGVVRGGALVLSGTDIGIVLSVSLVLWATHAIWRERSGEEIAASVPTPVLALVQAAMLTAVVLAQGGGNAFLYFQF